MGFSSWFCHWSELIVTVLFFQMFFVMDVILVSYFAQLHYSIGNPYLEEYLAMKRKQRQDAEQEVY